MITIIAVIAIAAATYCYVLALAYRIGLGRHPHARIWSRPRPLRLLAHGTHETRRTPQQERPAAAPARAVAARS